MRLPKFIVCMDGTFRLGMVNQQKPHMAKGFAWHSVSHV